jgi:hypothetical protein
MDDAVRPRRTLETRLRPRIIRRIERIVQFIHTVALDLQAPALFFRGLTIGFVQVPDLLPGEHHFATVILRWCRHLVPELFIEPRVDGDDRAANQQSGEYEHDSERQQIRDFARRIDTMWTVHHH